MNILTRRWTVRPLVGVLFIALVVVAAASRGARSAPEFRRTTSPIQHVVIIFQENHSFDDVLGKLCATPSLLGPHAACDGATTGLLHDGTVIPLSQEPDVVPGVGHTYTAQLAAIDGGKMDGFDLITGCGSSTNYACYAQFDPSQIPNLAALAQTFVISDRTFEFGTPASWGAHLVLAAATLDGFRVGDAGGASQPGPGSGCDSGGDSLWWNGNKFVAEPSCIPDQEGNGPYRPSPVKYVPTIFDRVEQAGLTWKIYGAEAGGMGSGYGHTICPSFYECLGSSQRQNLVAGVDVISDANAGALPNLTIVTPTADTSQHNWRSMAQGDNWIGQVVGAVMNGPDWSSSAIFITYDDCGCFYDHVPPPSARRGLRVPMVIVSPYAKAGYTDSKNASFVSMLAYTEHTFGLAPLTKADANAYDYARSFDYEQRPLAPVRMTTTPVPASEKAWIATHQLDADDPT